jgi:hypothetical protein
MKKRFNTEQYPTGDLKQFIIDFNNDIEEIENGGETVSDSSRVMQLSMAVPKETFQVPLKDVYGKDQNSPDLPKYADMQAAILAWHKNSLKLKAMDESVNATSSSSTVITNKESKNQLKTIQTMLSDTVAAVAAVTNGGSHTGGRGGGRGGRDRRSQGGRGRGNDRRQGTSSSSADSKSEAGRPKFQSGGYCANCGLGIHKVKDCPVPLRTCEHCNKTGHMALACFKRLAEAQSEGGSGNKKAKTDAATTGATFVTTSGGNYMSNVTTFMHVMYYYNVWYMYLYMMSVKDIMVG